MLASQALTQHYLIMLLSVWLMLVSFTATDQAGVVQCSLSPHSCFRLTYIPFSLFWGLVRA